MRRIELALLVTAAFGIAGCERSLPQQGDQPQQPEAAAAETADPLSGESDAESSPRAMPQYSQQQVAAARQMAADLGVVLQQDASGDVVGIDTAAKRSWVDDYQMKEMLVFPGLQSLTVEGPSITDELAPRIAECRGLTFLAMRNTLISDTGLRQLAGLQSLKVIDLRVSPLVTDAAMEILAGLPELRAVRLIGVNLTDAGVASLLKLPLLSELDVRNCRGVTAQGIEQLRGKKTLRILKLGGPQIEDPVLEIVATLSGLRGLSLDNCSVTDAGVGNLGKLPLTDLTLYQSARVTDQGLAMLASLDGLESLTLRDIAADGSALAGLPKPEKLKSLNMAQSKLSDAQVPQLARLTNLQTLNLSETAVTDAAVESLAQLKSLRRLVLTQTGVSGPGAQRLRDALPECDVQN